MKKIVVWDINGGENTNFKIWYGYDIVTQLVKTKDIDVVITPKYKIIDGYTLSERMDYLYSKSNQNISQYKKLIIKELQGIQNNRDHKRGCVTLYNLQTYSCDHVDFEGSIQYLFSPVKKQIQLKILWI